MKDLPSVIYQIIFSVLNHKELAIVARVNTIWKIESENNLLWILLAMQYADRYQIENAPVIDQFKNVKLLLAQSIMYRNKLISMYNEITVLGKMQNHNKSSDEESKEEQQSGQMDALVYLPAHVPSVSFFPADLLADSPVKSRPIKMFAQISNFFARHKAAKRLNTLSKKFKLSVDEYPQGTIEHALKHHNNNLPAATKAETNKLAIGLK